jgi:uncharacterized membrane protein YbhN (UPF0104 family)
MAGVGSERAQRADTSVDESVDELRLPERDEIPTEELGPEVARSAEEADEAADSFFARPKRLIQTGVLVLLLIGGIYFLFPKVVGVEGTFQKFGDAEPIWLAVALAMAMVMFLSYGALFRGVTARGLDLSFPEAYQITMAGLAAALLFSAGGAGGVVLTYWAITKAGLEARRAVCRMIAFLVLLYGVYVTTVVVDGILLRTGVLHGPHPVGLTIVPAGIATAVIVIFLLISLIPSDLERRAARLSNTGRLGGLARRLAPAPATLARGTKTALYLVRSPGGGSGGGLAIAGAIGYWAANVGILWASFHAYGVSVPLGVVVMGFFVGLAANLVPGAPAGVGAVDAGMIGVFVLFGFNGTEVFPAILTYRLFAFWLPIPPGVFAFFKLRRTVARWEAERRQFTRVGREMAGARATL